jgi:endogenous inhibitor of DNA gyrase (YacG/DUF329 family)
MSDQVITYRCKVCGALKGETNHWRTVGIVATSRLSPAFFICEEWDDETAQDESRSVACGERCSLILFERWLSTGSIEPPQPNKIPAQAE